MKDIKNYLRESRKQEIEATLDETISKLESEGLHVEFGKIGIRTTYALIYDESHEVEVVGYTFVKNMRFYQESVGRLKALQQAIARREMISDVERTH